MRAETRPTRGDQAEGLRRLARPNPVRVIAVTSGKGGVGKTNVSVNLAVAFAALGREVMLLDADLGLANVDVLLGLSPRYNLSHVLAGQCGLEDILVDGPGGIRIVPAASGIQRMAGLTAAEHAGLIHAFATLPGPLDVLIVDTAAGISDSVIRFTCASQEVIVVVCDEPASLTDAYALIKVLSRDHARGRFRILANMARNEAEGRDLYTRLVRVTDRFLDVTLDYAGTVPYDEYLKRAVQRQRAVVEAYPASRAATAFKKLAQLADKWPVAEQPAGHLQFFWERMVTGGSGPPSAEAAAATGAWR
jgi:flagellar biosynthesis protein FlhG